MKNLQTGIAEELIFVLSNGPSQAHVYYNYIKSQGPFQNVYLFENVPDLSFYVSILFFKFHSTLVWSILYSVQVFSRQYSIEQYMFLRE